MLRFYFTDIYDNELTVTDVISLDINIEEDVPADDMRAKFSYFECDELKSVVVYSDEQVVFTGVVDEQQVIKDIKGEYVKVVARSLASLLLDNESMPVGYTNPGTNLMLRRHLSPFGLKLKSDSERAFYGIQLVLKGDSNYKTVQDFSKKVYGGNPRVNEKGELCFPEKSESAPLVFCDSGQGINYFSYQKNIRRCDEISSVKIKLMGQPDYSAEVVNKNAKSRGIMRQRYLDAYKTDTPAVYAQKMIDNSKKKAFVLTLSCMGRHLGILLKDAIVADSVYGKTDKLYVSALRYSLSENGEYTVVSLKRKDDFDVAT